MTEFVRQNNKLFIELLNKVWVGNIGDDKEHLLKATFIYKSDENYPKDALHTYAEIELGMKKNEAALNEFSGELLHNRGQWQNFR